MENPIHKKSHPSLKDRNDQLSSISGLMTLLAATLVVVIGIKYIATDLIAPILMAVFLSILLMPVYRFYRNKDINKGWSILLMVITLIAIGGGLVVFVTYSFSVLRSTLSEYTSQFSESLNQLAVSLGINKNTAEEVSSSISSDAVMGILTSILGNLGELAMYLLVVPILAITLLLQADSIPKEASDKLMEENPSFSKFTKFADSIMVYVRGRFKVNAVTGLLFAISLVIIGVDFPFLWGTITIFLSFIPYLGLVLAATPPVLLAFAEYGVWGAVAVIVCVAIINMAAENILEPYIQGKGNKISTASVIIAVIFWGWLLGPVGLILAAPLTVLLKIVLADYKETAWIASLIEGDYSKIPSKNDRSESRIGKAFRGFKSILPGSS